jgi:hypothetical protein
VELLIDDGPDQGLKGRLAVRKAKGARSDALDQAAKFGIGGCELGDGFVDIVGQLA